MRQIVVISGKGGTGKTSLTAAFTAFSGPEAVLADCDVDAADMHLITGARDEESSLFKSGEAAVVDPDACIGCGRCQQVCRFDAIRMTDGVASIRISSCEGCGYCSRVCPAGAIRNEEQVSGDLKRSRRADGGVLVHARLHPGAENSGKLVAAVKKEAIAIAKKTGAELVIADGSPGIGCPVVSSLSGADYCIAVTEPTVSGLHDLKRVLELVRRFSIPVGCIVNKADLNEDMTEKIGGFLERNGIELLGTIGYDKSFTRSMIAGHSIAGEGSSESVNRLAAIWKKVTSSS